MPTLTCTECAKPFEVIPARLRRGFTPKFCGKTCYEQARQLNPKPCEWCKVDFAPRTKAKRFCSNACSAKAKGQRKSSEGRVACVCEVCREPFTIKAGRLKLVGQGRFCSKACFYKGRKNVGMTGKTHSPEVRAQMGRGHKETWAKKLGPEAAAQVGTPERNRKLMRERKARAYQDPKWNLIFRLRNSVRQAIRKRLMNQAMRGAFKLLPYDPETFVNDMMAKLEACNWECPMCKASLRKRFDIDHHVPLNTAKTIEEVVALFALDNLRPLCKRCNNWKRARVPEERAG